VCVKDVYFHENQLKTGHNLNLFTNEKTHFEILSPILLCFIEKSQIIGFFSCSRSFKDFNNRNSTQEHKKIEDSIDFVSHV